MRTEISLDFDSLNDQHADFCLKNPNLFIGEHFSTIQYSNFLICQNHLKISIDIYNILSRMSRNNTYLNLGMGPGFLENLVDIHGKINLESVEWIEQKENFSIIRKFMDIDNRLTYDCNSIYDENFEIYNCNKKYDYILLIRFYPLNKASSNLDQVKTLLNRLKKYSDKALICDSMSTNYNDDVLDYFKSIKSQYPVLPHHDFNIISLKDA